MLLFLYSLGLGEAFAFPQLDLEHVRSARQEFWGKERSRNEIQVHISDCLATVDHKHKISETVHVISAEPPLILIHDFLPTTMCEDVIQMAKASQKLARSTTGNSKYVSESRTSSSVWLSDKECPEPSRLIAEKVSRISGLPPSYMENLQVCRYQQGQEFNLHTDHQDNFNGLECGGRLATCLIYLAEPKRGGETWFSDLGNVKIPASQGTAVFFWNTMEKPGSKDYKPDMFLRTDMRMRHAGLPVEEGEKWICNRWIHPLGFPAGVRGLQESEIEIAPS